MRVLLLVFSAANCLTACEIIFFSLSRSLALIPPFKRGISCARGTYSRQPALVTFHVVAQEHDLIPGVIYGAR